MADSVERTFRQVAADKGLEFHIVLDEHLPQAIQTDGKRLQQILANLLSNAFKFTAKGEVRLRIEQVSSGWSMGHPVLDRGGPAIAFSVSDTGIGIPPSKQRLIFEAFQQPTAPPAASTAAPASGSRSAASSRACWGRDPRGEQAGRGQHVHAVPAAEQHVSRATPQASDNKRAAMGKRPARARGRSTRRRPEAGQALAGRKALVVDDDIRNVFAMTSALEMHGMTVLHADSGREAVETLKREGNVDLVLMDVMMPGSTASTRSAWCAPWRATAPCRSSRSPPRRCSATARSASGANEYLAKPVNVDVLLAPRLPERCRPGGLSREADT